MARAPFSVLIFPYNRSSAGIDYAVFRRSDSVEDFWQALSGGGEDSETPTEAARREAWEEARISPDHTFNRLDSQASIPVEDPERRKLWGESVIVIPEYCFAVEVKRSVVKISEEHTEYRWLDFPEARDLLKFRSNKTALWELNERLRRGTLNL